jgi:hypothetical protein
MPRLLGCCTNHFKASSAQLQFGDINVSGTSSLKQGVRDKPIKISFTPENSEK